MFRYRGFIRKEQILLEDLLFDLKEHKISVIVPVSGKTSYLSDCLDSLVAQEGLNIEVIIVDDRAEDTLDSILKRYEEVLCIKKVVLQGKQGVAAARNLGLSVAEGDYVYFLDSDDYLFINTLEKLLRATLKKDAQIAFGRKRGTWFKRAVYMEEYYKKLAEKEAAKAAEEEEEEDADSAAGAGTLLAEAESELQSEAEEEEADALEEELQAAETEIMVELTLEEEAARAEKLARRAEALRRSAFYRLVRKKKGLANVSVLHILIKRSLIEEHNIRFREDFVYFSDLSFVIQVLFYAERFARNFSSRYVKRKHNDPINFPALSQLKDENRFEEYVEAYCYTKTLVPQDHYLYDALERKLLSYFTRIFAPRIRRSKKDTWRNEHFETMRKLVSEVNPERIKALKGYRKRIVKALLSGNVKKAHRVVSMHLAKKKFKRMLKNRRVLYRYLYLKQFSKLPIKENWVMFESFFGRQYSDSPRSIYEYMAQNNDNNYRFIWTIEDKKTDIPYGATKVKRYSLRYVYYLARCKYFVFNVRQPQMFKKRDGMVFLETWHGTPLKRLVFDQEEVLAATPLYKEQFFRQAKEWDYLVAPNEFSSEVFRGCFMFKNTMLETGYPRNDVLHAKDRDEHAKQLRKQLGIPENKTTILYAPTWRDDEYYDKGQYKFELKLNLQQMKEELGANYVVLLRTHYYIADAIDLSDMEGFAMNFCKHSDIAELYLVSDILITDYSSVFFDYAGLRRPVLFYTYDLEKYRDMLRGFYISIEEDVPGPLAFTTGEVISYIKNIDAVMEQYKERYDVFYKRFCSWEDGQAAKKVVEQVFKK